MPKFSSKSLLHLSGANPLLQKLFNSVILDYDCTILESQRGRAAQEDAFRLGNSRAHFSESAHNYQPSVAVDAVPYPSNWNDIAEFKKFGAIVYAHARTLQIPIQWGGDWDSPLRDYDHFELKPWREWAANAHLFTG